LLIAKDIQTILIHQEEMEASDGGLEIPVPAHTVMDTMTAAVSMVEDTAVVEMEAAGTAEVVDINITSPRSSWFLRSFVVRDKVDLKTGMADKLI
jgi:hypothetical protein